MLPGQSILPSLRAETSCSDLYDQIVPSTPNGTLTMKIACQSIDASMPPRISPRKVPAMAAIWLTPIANPRRFGGKASVRIAVEFANSMAPPTACTTRHPISQRAPAAAGERIEDQGDRGDGEDRESEVVDAHAAVDVAEAAEADHENRGHQDVAHQHPEQVAHVARLERVELDSGEDRGQRDQHDRPVDRRHQHAERGVAQGDPFVVRVILVEHARALALGLRRGGHASSLRHIVTCC